MGRKRKSRKQERPPTARNTEPALPTDGSPEPESATTSHRGAHIAGGYGLAAVVLAAVLGPMLAAWWGGEEGDFVGVANTRRSPVVAGFELVEGIGREEAGLLRGWGIADQDALLLPGSWPRALGEARAQNLDQGEVFGWFVRRRLAAVRGIGREYADLLAAAGVTSVLDLATREAAKLLVQLQNTNRRRHLVARLPAVNDLADWIARAQTNTHAAPTPGQRRTVFIGVHGVQLMAGSAPCSDEHAVSLLAVAESAWKLGNDLIVVPPTNSRCPGDELVDQPRAITMMHTQWGLQWHGIEEKNGARGSAMLPVDLWRGEVAEGSEVEVVVCLWRGLRLDDELKKEALELSHEQGLIAAAKEWLASRRQAGVIGAFSIRIRIQGGELCLEARPITGLAMSKPYTGEPLGVGTAPQLAFDDRGLDHAAKFLVGFHAVDGDTGQADSSYWPCNRPFLWFWSGEGYTSYGSLWKHY